MLEPRPTLPRVALPRDKNWHAFDEERHLSAAVEAWWWWGASVDGDAGVFVGLELRGDRFDYWAGLVRADEAYLYIEELDGRGLRDGLEIKPAEMWADHDCDVAFEQWSLGNEAHGVLLDDPEEAWRRAYGAPVPVTFDIEWYATSAPESLQESERASGYRQDGEVDCQIELSTGLVEFVGPAHRVHTWGAAYLPSSFAMPIARSGLRAPYRRSDGQHVDQVLTDRWWISTIGRPT